MQQKVAKFAQILGILNNILKPPVVRKFSGIIVYNALTLPIPLYGSEIWTHRKKDKKRLTPVEMKCFRRIAGYTLFDHKRNEEILEELKIESVDEKVRRCK